MTDSEKLDLLIEKFNVLENRFDSLENRVDDIQAEVKKANLILGNEIRINIQRIAEGHFDLSRNLHEAMRASNEIEMIAIKVRMLESDMLEVKRKIS